LTAKIFEASSRQLIKSKKQQMRWAHIVVVIRRRRKKVKGYIISATKGINQKFVDFLRHLNFPTFKRSFQPNLYVYLKLPDGYF